MTGTTLATASCTASLVSLLVLPWSRGSAAWLLLIALCLSLLGITLQLLAERREAAESKRRARLGTCDTVPIPAHDDENTGTKIWQKDNER